MVFPLPTRVSVDASGDRHTEYSHPVENAAPDFCFCPLIGESPGVESPADRFWCNLSRSLTELRIQRNAEWNSITISIH
jgi:hypothetical protein